MSIIKLADGREAPKCKKCGAEGLHVCYPTILEDPGFQQLIRNQVIRTITSSSDILPIIIKLIIVTMLMCTGLIFFLGCLVKLLF